MGEIAVAGCVIRDEQGRVMLLRRVLPDGAGRWEIPGGKQEEGESAAAAAVREAREELGVEIALGTGLGVGRFPDGTRTVEYTGFTATITSGTPAPQEDAHDEIGYFPLPALTAGRIAVSGGVRCLCRALADGQIAL
ncbi:MULTISPECIES: NUDIX hydrolase [Actinosynnema]|uniref:NUDIX hydrolase n=1 Tax=Actinosynnema TaxID=40566 RepID=UPI0020A4A81E|nr:NUDIX domain-containing protein [Actinosynnema pretiosum]MCP2097403.1 8-oxo-dGTP diphosphatase [Actinosynnema pretiosum]